jgi:ABC-type polysaccharide/polyol phosphate export permease
MIGGLWIHRKFIFKNALNDLRQRYAGSALGISWNVFNPLAQILVYTFVFSQVMAARLPNVSSTYAFAIYLCSGLLPWISFSETILRGANSLLENSTYLKKLPIPEQIFVAQVTVSSTLVLSISMILLFIINILLGGHLAISWLALPLILLLFQGLAFGIALALSCLNVFFRDIGQLIGIFLQIWMWMTPIVYVKDILPASYQEILLYNPVYPYIESLHKIVVFGQWPEQQYWIFMLVFCLLSVIIGMLFLSKLQTEIRDVL